MWMGFLGNGTILGSSTFLIQQHQQHSIMVISEFRTAALLAVVRLKEEETAATMTWVKGKHCATPQKQQQLILPPPSIHPFIQDDNSTMTALQQPPSHNNK